MEKDTKFTFVSILYFISLFLYSCGGGPSEYDIGINDQCSSVVIDMCKKTGEENSECEISYPEPLCSVTLSSKVLKDEFDDTEKVAYQVSQCRFRWTPLNDWSPNLDVSSKFSCNDPSIPADGEANLKISIHQDLLKDMKDYYDKVSMGRPLSYLLEVTVVIRPYYGGEEKEVKIYIPIDFNDVADEEEGGK